MTRPGTLGELKSDGWVSRPVKEEVRANALTRIAEGRPLASGAIIPKPGPKGSIYVRARKGNGVYANNPGVARCKVR